MYARPIEGVVAVVNMNTRQVDRVIGLGMYPIPTQHGDLNEADIGRAWNSCWPSHTER